ncbi:MAG: tetratricopeptide repeat protein [Thiohalomonadales bacterium]
MNIRHRHMIPCFIALLLFIGNAPVFANNFEKLEDGQRAFNLGYYFQAFKIWHSQALSGDSDAQMFVGLAFRNGWGVPKDRGQSIKWYKMSAEQDNTAAQFLLGVSLINSEINTEVKSGIKWLHKAAANGDPEALKFLDKAKRKQWFTVSDDVTPATKETNAAKPTQKQVLPQPVSISLSNTGQNALPTDSVVIN